MKMLTFTLPADVAQHILDAGTLAIDTLPLVRVRERVREGLTELRKVVQHHLKETHKKQQAKAKPVKAKPVKAKPSKRTPIDEKKKLRAVARRERPSQKVEKDSIPPDPSVKAVEEAIEAAGA